MPTITFDLLARGNADREVRKLGDSIDHLDDRTRKLGTGLGELGGRMSLIMTKAGAVGPAILAAGSAVSATASSAVALAGAVGPAAAAGIVAYGAAYAGVESGAKLASWALDGVTDAATGDEKAMAKLTPRGRELARTLMALAPEVTKVRTAAQDGMFPGVEFAANRIGHTYLPLVTAAAGETGAALGGLAADSARLVATPMWRRDFATLAARNAANIGDMGHAGLFLADAGRSLIATSEPVQKMFFAWAVGAAESVDKTVQAARAAGTLDRFWAIAARDGAEVGHILGNVAGGLYNVFQIGASGTGRDMLANVEQMTEDFREWTGSANGARSIAQWFATGRENVAAMQRLTVAVFGDMRKIGAGTEFAPLVDDITKKVLPPLTEFLHNASAGGALNALVAAGGEVLQVFADLSDHDGSLTSFATSLEAIAHAADFVVTEVPGAGAVLGTFFTIAGGASALKFAGLGGVVNSVASSMTGQLVPAMKDAVFGLQAWRAGAATTGEALGQMGGAARLAAGAGGMVAFTAGAHQSNEAVGTLLQTLGGAATGFSVGGPWGALIGGAAGLAMGVFSHKTDAAGDSAVNAEPKFSDLASTLNDLSGATTAATRAMVYDDLQRNGALTQLNAYGVSSRTVVDAVLGQKKAMGEVNAVLDTSQGHYDGLIAKINDLKEQQKSYNTTSGANYGAGGGANNSRAIQQQIDALQAQADAEKHFGDSVRGEIGTLQTSTLAMRQRAIAVSDYASAFKGLDVKPQVITEFKTSGIPDSVKSMASLQHRYGLTQKQIKTIIEVGGVDVSLRRTEQVAQHLNDVSKARPHLEKGYLPALAAGGADGQKIAKSSGSAIADLLTAPIASAHADTSNLSGSLRAGLGTARGIAASGGAGIGAALADGLAGAITSRSGIIASAAAGAVYRAVHAAKAAGDIRSPSRVMRDQVGRELARGVVVGMDAEGGRVADAGGALVQLGIHGANAAARSRAAAAAGQRVGDGVADGARSVHQHLSDAGADVVRNLVKGIDSHQVELQRVLDAVQGRVESAAAKVQRLLSTRADTVATFQGFATSIFATPQATDANGEALPLSVDDLLNAQAGQRDQAVQVRADVARLRSMHLNKSLLDQLQAAGAAGIPQIHALAQADPAQIALANSLEQQTRAAYKATGMGVFSTEHGAELAGAKQRERDSRELLDAIRDLADKFDKGQRDELVAVLRGDDIAIVLKRHDQKKGNRR